MASDAFMMVSFHVPMNLSQKIFPFISYQTTNASAQISIPFRLNMCCLGVPCRRTGCILCVLSSHPRHPIHHLQTYQKVCQPMEWVLSTNMHYCWRDHQWCCCTYYHITRCGKNNSTDVWNIGGMMDAFKVIWTWDGIKGFLTMHVLTIMPNSALCWLSYEFFSTCCLLMFFFFCLCSLSSCAGGSVWFNPNLNLQPWY